MRRTMLESGTSPSPCDTALTIRAARITLPNNVLEDGIVSIRNGRIESITPAAEAAAGTIYSFSFPRATLLPGAIDLHVHGSSGWRIGSGAPQEEVLVGMSQSLARSGVTAFLPTIATATDEILTETVKSVARLIQTQNKNIRLSGAEILGSHLEGPYLNPRRKGAMRADLMQLPNQDHFELFWEASEGTIRYLTLAPELPGAQVLVHQLVERNIFVSAGHTDALASQMYQAFAEGVKGITHLFNAMRGLHHREPGVVGAALNASEVWVELIGDGIHVHPTVMRLAIELKGTAQVAIVSDAGRYAGQASGAYVEKDRTVIVEGVRCSFPDGTLAGSASPMNRNLMLLHRELGLSWPEIARMTAVNPAIMLGIESRKGSLEVGKEADIIVLDDTGNIQLTLVRGQIAYTANEEVDVA